MHNMSDLQILYKQIDVSIYEVYRLGRTNCVNLYIFNGPTLAHAIRVYYGSDRFAIFFYLAPRYFRRAGFINQTFFHNMFDSFVFHTKRVTRMFRFHSLRNSAISGTRFIIFFVSIVTQSGERSVRYKISSESCRNLQI